MNRRALLALALAGVILNACAEAIAKRPTIKVAALALIGAHDRIQLTEDGRVFIAGTKAARIAGDHVDAPDGNSILTIGGNGRLSGKRVPPGYKFEGDDLLTDAGAKLSVRSDGAVTITKDRNSETIATIEGALSAKRAALVLTVLWLPIPMYVTTDTSKVDATP